MTQTAALLDLLRRNGEDGCTALQALREIGSFRLAARVWELRDAGHHLTGSRGIGSWSLRANWR
jgi:hypothetical protein